MGNMDRYPGKSAPAICLLKTQSHFQITAGMTVLWMGAVILPGEVKVYISLTKYSFTWRKRTNDKTLLRTYMKSASVCLILYIYSLPPYFGMTSMREQAQDGNVPGLSCMCE